MATDLTHEVRDARPPAVLVRATNPILKVLLRTPLSRVIRPLALIEFRGRRTDRPIRVVVAWHMIEGLPVVVTPAAWRINFSGGAPATVHRRGRREQYIGTLETDPRLVAKTIDAAVQEGASPRAFALRAPTGHVITDDDVLRTGRAIVRFRKID